MAAAIAAAVVSAGLVLLFVLYLRLYAKFRRFRSMIEHSLRSPLNAILGFSDLLLRTETDEERKEFLNAIKSGGEGILRSVEEASPKMRKIKVPGSAERLNRRISRNICEEEGPGKNEPLILVVENNSEDLLFLERVLKKSGLRTAAAVSGEDALDAAGCETPDLILLDIDLPGISGFETCAKIHSDPDLRNIPVIFLSSHKSEKTIIEGFIYGGIDFIVKPFTSPELLARVNTHLQLKRTKERLHDLAFSDPLTGLYNRRMLLDVMTQEIARAARYKGPLSFIMIDIDHFKLVNDNYGHEAGDKALRFFADTLRANLRETDMAGRLGGEEFGVLLPMTSMEQAGIVAERIRSTLEKNSAAAGDGIPAITASFGISEFGKSADTPETMVKKADEALYRAKDSGRNRVVGSGQPD